MNMFAGDLECGEGCPRLGRFFRKEIVDILEGKTKNIASHNRGLEKRIKTAVKNLIKESETRDSSEITALEKRANAMVHEYGFNLYNPEHFEKRREQGKIIYQCAAPGIPFQKIVLRNKSLLRWINKAFKVVGYDHKSEDDISGLNFVVVDPGKVSVDFYDLSSQNHAKVIENLRAVERELEKRKQDVESKPLTEQKRFWTKFNKSFDRRCKGEYHKKSHSEMFSHLKSLYKTHFAEMDDKVAYDLKENYKIMFSENLIKLGPYFVNYKGVVASVKCQEAMSLHRPKNSIIFDSICFGFRGDEDLRTINNSKKELFSQRAADFMADSRSNPKYSKLKGRPLRPIFDCGLSLDEIYFFQSEGDDGKPKKNILVRKENVVIRYEEMNNSSIKSFVENCRNFILIQLSENKMSNWQKEAGVVTTGNILPGQKTPLAHNFIVYSNEEPQGWLFSYPAYEYGRIENDIAPPIQDEFAFKFYFKDYKKYPKKSTGYTAYQAKEEGEREIKIMTPLDYYEAELGSCAHGTYTSASGVEMKHKILEFCREYQPKSSGTEKTKITKARLNNVERFIYLVFKTARKIYPEQVMAKADNLRELFERSSGPEAIQRFEEFVSFYQRYSQEIGTNRYVDNLLCGLPIDPPEKKQALLSSLDINCDKMNGNGYI